MKSLDIPFHAFFHTCWRSTLVALHKFIFDALKLNKSSTQVAFPRFFKSEVWKLLWNGNAMKYRPISSFPLFPLLEEKEENKSKNKAQPKDTRARAWKRGKSHHPTDLYPWECTCEATQADIGIPISELVQRAGTIGRRNDGEEEA